MGKTKKAISSYTKAGKYGHRDADFAIGKLYFDNADFPSAFEFFAKGAQQGHFKSTQYYGWMVENNLGITATFMHFSEAAQYHRKAAEMGCRESMTVLGQLYIHGMGVVRNYQQAVKYLSKAAELEDAEASFSLGKLYERGVGVDKDTKESVKWYKLSSKLGNVYATFALRRLEMLGVEVKEKKVPPPVPVRDRSATVSAASSPKITPPPKRNLPPLPLTRNNNGISLSTDGTSAPQNGKKIEVVKSNSDTSKKVIGTVRF